MILFKKKNDCAFSLVLVVLCCAFPLVLSWLSPPSPAHLKVFPLRDIPQGYLEGCREGQGHLEGCREGQEYLKGCKAILGQGERRFDVLLIVCWDHRSYPSAVVD